MNKLKTVCIKQRNGYDSFIRVPKTEEDLIISHIITYLLLIANDDGLISSQYSTGYHIRTINNYITDEVRKPITVSNFINIFDKIDKCNVDKVKLLYEIYDSVLYAMNENSIEALEYIIKCDSFCDSKRILSKLLSNNIKYYTVNGYDKDTILNYLNQVNFNDQAYVNSVKSRRVIYYFALQEHRDKSNEYFKYIQQSMNYITCTKNFIQLMKNIRNLENNIKSCKQEVIELRTSLNLVGNFKFAYVGIDNSLDESLDNCIGITEGLADSLFYHLKIRGYTLELILGNYKREIHTLELNTKVVPHV